MRAEEKHRYRPNVETVEGRYLAAAGPFAGVPAAAGFVSPSDGVQDVAHAGAQQENGPPTLALEGQAPQSAEVARATGTFKDPLDRMQLTSPFGWRPAPGEPNNHRMHEGADYAANTGTPVKAADGGVIVRAASDDGYGLNVVIEHGGGWYTRYAHLSGILVQTGQSVSQGQQIGKAGNTGTKSSGPHLHFEIRHYDGYGDRLYSHPFNPQMYLGKKYTSLGELLEANPDLQEGDGGDRRHAVFAVRQLQSTLKSLRYDIKVDGIFGKETRAAVVSFQNKHHLTPDGIVGRQTWRALAEAIGQRTVSEIATIG